MSLKLRVMLKAVNIRMENGEDLEAILESYHKLTEEEKDEIREKVSI